MVSTIEIKRYTDDQSAQWDKFVRQSRTPIFMFERNYMDYHRDRYADHSLLLYNDSRLVALMPANESENCLQSHGGLTFGGVIFSDNVRQYSANECFRSLMIYLKEHGFKLLEYKPIPHIYHNQPAQDDLYALHQVGGKLNGVAASTVLQFDRPLKMPKGRKAQIKRAIREGVVIKEECEEASYCNFIELENEVLTSRHNTRAVHTAKELYMLYERFPKNIHLITGQINDKTIAGSVVYEYENVVHIQYMAANETARRIGALDLIIYSIMERYKTTKQWLDFGISTEKCGTYLNEGLIAQKEGFGGRTNIYTLWELRINN